LITSELVREGRKVARVRFKLKERAKKTRLGSHVNEGKERKSKASSKLLPLPDDLLTQLIHEFAFTPEAAQQLLVDYAPDVVKTKINAIKKSKPYQKGEVQNLPGYVLTALKKDYQFTQTKLHEVINIQDIKYEIEWAELKKHIEKVRHEYQRYRERAIHEAIQALNAETKEGFMKKFLDYAEPAIQTVLQLQRKKYTKHNVMESPQIKALIRQFAMRELDLFSISFEEFVAQQDDVVREAWQKLKSYNPDHPLLKFSEV